MIWTEITETDFKLGFVFSVSYRAICLWNTLKWWPKWWSGNILHKPLLFVCLVSSVSHVCLSLCFPLQWNKISSCHSVCQNPNCPFHFDVLYEKQCSTGSSICGCIYISYVWHSDSHLQHLPGQKGADDPEKKKRKKPWKRSSCRRSNSARFVRHFLFCL